MSSNGRPIVLIVEDNLKGEMRDVWEYLEETGKYKYINPDDLKFASAVKDGVQLFEVAVPKKPDIGLNIEKGEKIGLMIYITPKDKAHISLFEPWSIFDMTVQ